MKQTLLTVLVGLVANGCHSGITGPADLGVAGDMAAAPVQKVDILLMMDNSVGTAPKLSELRQAFPTFAKILGQAAAAHPASYHIGVVTSDLGAGTNTTSCRAGGDGGKLQVGPNPQSSSVPPACSTFNLGGGVRFIDYDQRNATDNLGGLDLPTALNCIASVGPTGCGFEHPLESVYKALHDAVPENHDFLRPDALLVVIFLTDEDDCSAPPDTDLFDVATDTYGPLDSFRCTQYGIACGTPAKTLTVADAEAPLSGCRPLQISEGGKLFDVQRYIDFFTRPAAMGGVKENPANVIVAAIAAPLEPFSIKNTTPCVDQPNAPSCLWLNSSCPTGANFGAAPAVRLGAVVNAVANSQLTSVCDFELATPLDAVAQRILARLQ